MTSHLASLPCSGESLEKALVLTYFALTQNAPYYTQFDRIHVFYSDNLPKAHGEGAVHGSLGALIEHGGDLDWLPYSRIDDTWDDRDTVLQRLVAAKRISNRMSDALSKNHDRFVRTAVHIPWIDVFPDVSARLIQQFQKEFPNVSFHRLDLRVSIDDVLLTTPRYSLTKAYFLDPNGVISSRAVQKPMSLQHDVCDPIRTSIVSSGNVYMFIADLLRVSNLMDPVPSVGYRELTRHPRRSYNAAISFVRRVKVDAAVVEPRTGGFSTVLDGLVGVPQPRLPTEGVYHVFGRLVSSGSMTL